MTELTAIAYCIRCEAISASRERNEQRAEHLAVLADRIDAVRESLMASEPAREPGLWPWLRRMKSKIGA